MDAFSTKNQIAFVCSKKAAVAKFDKGKIKSSSYFFDQNSLEFINCEFGNEQIFDLQSFSSESLQRISQKHKRMHAAEHMVYKAFTRNLRKLPKILLKSEKYSDLKVALPSLKQVLETDSFSVFCGTTAHLLSGLLLIACLLSILCQTYLQKKPYFNFLANLALEEFIKLFLVLVVFTSLALIALKVVYFIQKKYFLAKPKLIEIQIALAALKELCNAKHIN